MSIYIAFLLHLFYQQFIVFIITYYVVDVHHQLAQLFPTVTYNYSTIQTIDSSVDSIFIPNWTCNDIDYTIFDFSRFIKVESIEVGDECFGSVKTFKIEGLNRSRTIKIGKKSFTQMKNDYGDESKSFQILNCESLKSIQIGEYSFSDFGRGISLKNLPQLQTIRIGTIGSKSYNFCNSSFMIGGIELILNIIMIRSSKSTIHFIR